jgi:hypothetical protein
MASGEIMDAFYTLAGKLLFKPIAAIVLFVTFAFEGYHIWGPDNGDLGFMRHKLADAVCTEAIQELPHRQGVQSIAVLDLAGDSTGVVSKLLRDKIEAQGIYNLLDESFFRKLIKQLGRSSASPVVRLEDAVDAARKIGVDAVIFGELPQFSLTADGAVLRLELRMAERDSGKAVFARAYSRTYGGSRIAGSYWRARLADSSGGRRIFVWIVFALLLPLLTVPLLRKLTATDSNLINLAMLIGYTLVDMLFAFFLTGFWIHTLWTALILLAALGLSAFYNYCIMSFVEKMRH